MVMEGETTLAAVDVVGITGPRGVAATTENKKSFDFPFFSPFFLVFVYMVEFRNLLSRALSEFFDFFLICINSL
jgi:hypothetical protein